jgi:hypothetical protein
MRFSTRSVLVLAAVCAVALGVLAQPVCASFNQLPNVPNPTYAQFLAAGFNPVNSALNTVYNTGGSHPVTGNMTSRVFKSGSTYAYLYQVSIANTVPNTKNLVINYKVTPWASAFGNFTLIPKNGPQPVYQIDVLGKNQANTSGFTFFNNTGNKSVSTAQGVDHQFLQANFVNSNSNGLRRGTTSMVLVVFSNLAPKIGNSHITVAGAGTGSADTPVYVPAPEPSSLVMLAIGGAGLVGLPMWRRRRPAQA